MSPISNAYVRPISLNSMEAFYPLHAYFCQKCFLVQLQEFESPGSLFRDYAYFSSYSDSWLEHCRRYVGTVTERFNLGPQSLVVELASNDGYLLQYFKDRKIPILGVEPAENVARVAIQKGIPTEVVFFGTETAQRLKARGVEADLLLGNNVLAHVPDLNGFVKGMSLLLKPRGVITMEFPHLLRLMEENQFDTIYHEHFSYFSLLTAEQVFRAHGLKIFDVEELPTHGGSLRIYATHLKNDSQPLSPRVEAVLSKEIAQGLNQTAVYLKFAEKVKRTKWKLLSFLTQAKTDGKKIVAYGAPAKGNTLLNYCGIRTDFIDFTVDRNPHKQGLYLPGTRIPIVHPDRILEAKPDYLLILPWNLREEIMAQMSVIRQWGGKFVVPIPQVEVI